MMQGRGANDLDHDDAREVLRYNGEKKMVIWLIVVGAAAASTFAGAFLTRS
jgi:hypothetical protein